MHFGKYVCKLGYVDMYLIVSIHACTSNQNMDKNKSNVFGLETRVGGRSVFLVLCSRFSLI